MSGTEPSATEFSLVKLVLNNATFVNPDIGSLNDAMNIDYFILSIPKCGTTAIQRGLERLGRSVIHAHTNASTYAAFSNGRILLDNRIGMETIVKARISARSRPVYIFFGYREPVSWYLSMAGHFGLPMDATLCSNLIQNMESRFPWNSYKIDDISLIIYKSTGISIDNNAYDYSTGCNVIVSNNVKLIIYRFDYLKFVQDYIVNCIDEKFVLTKERVNEEPAYTACRRAFSISIGDGEHISKDRWFRYFYNEEERARVMKSYIDKGRV